MDRKRMVSSLVEYYTNGNKSQFAKMLGITPQTINTWISRNTFNAELIYAKCEGVSANWLLTGCGSMINEQEREVNASLQVQEKFPLKTDNLVDLQRIPFTIWRRRPDWFPCSTMSMRFRSAIYRCRICLHAMGLFMCAGIRCTHYSKAAILSFTSRYTTCSTGFSGVKCTLYRPMSMGTSS